MKPRSSGGGNDDARGEVITFYSYKGGTGRTMSMVNLACLLADRIAFRERILLIDWDLEAPGLHRYFHGRLKPSASSNTPHGSDATNHPGLIDLFDRLREAGGSDSLKRKRKPDVRAAALFDAVDLDDFVLATQLPNLDVMKAGRFDAGYGSRVNSFPWEGFYNQYPQAFREFAERLKRRYRYVFIDSRTGQTDTAGICTTLMPEKLVLVFTPNRQSLYGIETVLKDAVAYRRRDQDSRPLVAYPLPSRVEVAQDDLRAKWRFGDSTRGLEGYEPFLTQAMKAAYGIPLCHLKRFFDEVQIKHSPVYAFGEEIAVLNEKTQKVEDDYSLTRAYQNLLTWLEPGYLPWESPEAIRLMRSLEKRASAPRLEANAFTEDLAALRDLAKRFRAEGDRGNAELAIRTGESFARKCIGDSHRESLAFGGALAGLLLEQGKTDLACRAAENLVRLSAVALGDEHADTLEYKGILAQVLLAKGDHEQARALQAPALEVQRRVLGDEHPDTLSAMSNLAETLHTQGDLAGARALEESALATRRRVLGEEHPDTLTSMNNLARTLKDQGDHAGARALQESALATRRRVLGEEHPDSLTSMNDLAGTLQAQGDLPGARALQESVLATRRRVLGEEHPATLSSMNNLASTLWAQGDLAGARALQESALETRRRVLGEDHPATLSSMGNLAGTLHAQGNFARARALQESALATRRRVLGEAHPDTLTSMNNLAGTLQAQGELAGARALQESVLATRRRVLGEEHPATLTSMNNLALTLLAQGDLAKARALQESVLATQRRVLGEEHPATLSSMNNLASNLQRLGDLAGARALLESALATQRRVLGEEHPDTLSSTNNLASTLHAQGDLAGARALEESALATRRRVLGEEHPDTLSAMNNLAGTLKAQGDLTGARALEESALATRSRVLGEEHPDTLSTMNNLALTLKAQGDLAGARALLESVLETQRRVLGEAHPDTLVSMNNLAATFQAQGHLAGARALLELALATRRRVLGEEHPDTLTAMNNLAMTLQAIGQAEAAEALRKEANAARQRKAEKEEVGRQGTALRVVGIGGAGSKALDDIAALCLKDIGLVAIDADRAALDRSKAPQHVLLGAGPETVARPGLAELAAEQRSSQIREALAGARLLLIIAGLGGGTGSGAAPVIAGIAREMGIVTVGIVTTPFAFEGRRVKTAEGAAEKLLRKLDSLIVIPNDELIEKLGEDVSMEAAFASADRQIAGLVQRIVEIATTPGLVNIDLEDLRTIFANKGRAAAATAVAAGPKRAHDAVGEAIAVIEQKQGFRLASASGVLLNLTANSSLSLREYKDAMQTLRAKVAPAATVICGAVFDNELGDKLNVTLIAAGTTGASEARTILAQRT